jgi:hypothetical protein
VWKLVLWKTKAPGSSPGAFVRLDSGRAAVRFDQIFFESGLYVEGFLADGPHGLAAAGADEFHAVIAGGGSHARLR